MAHITLFTSPKPFDDPFIAMIQRNAFGSWRALGPQVEVVLFGIEAGVAEAAAEFGFRHQPAVRRNRFGTPLIADMFAQAQAQATTPWLAFLNADIILLPDFLRGLHALEPYLGRRRLLVSARRWETAITEPLDWATLDPAALARTARGQPLNPTGMDVFVFPRGSLRDLPDFAIGRAGWDNWMIYHARRARAWVVDATPDITVVHQRHDYRHLPGGRPHYQHEESRENVRLAGGVDKLYTLWEATHWLQGGRVRRAPWHWMHIARRLELTLLRRGQPHKGPRRVLLRWIRRRWQRPWLERGAWWLDYYGPSIVTPPPQTLPSP